ncbi:hypothetical protein FQN51_006393 [Onygenales sp. PD_10]|nr:hypothetical protein FQN51_006393 [Onygenales sp. PD_10]
MDGPSKGTNPMQRLKCNRQQPCHNCIARGHQDLCIFASGKAPKSTGQQTAGMEYRLNRLEKLVTTLTSGPEDPQQPSIDSVGHALATSRVDDPGQDSTIKEPGTMTVKHDESLYRGSTHWNDVLQELTELKSTWNQFKVDIEVESLDNAFSQGFSTHGPTITAGVPSLLDKAELLDSVPSKPAADKLISKFFDPNDPSAPTILAIHGPTFMKQYEEHWKDPSKTKVAWLGLLFSILWLTLQCELENEENAAKYMGMGPVLAEMYRMRTAQCLMHVDVTKSAPHLLETMCLQGFAEYIRKKDAESNTWVVLGMIMRTGMRMGIHRDPSNYPGLFSPFQTQMRRRLWAFISQVDLLFSFHIGLPSMISSTSTDTELPANLYDWELNEDMTETPPSRPVTEITEITHMVQKTRILRAIGKVSEYLYDIRQAPYERVLELDNEIYQVQKEIPDSHRITDWESIDRKYVLSIIERMHLDLVVNEGFCALHRKYLVPARTNPKYALSRQRCLQAAMSILDQQVGLNRPSMPGEPMPRDRWYLKPVANAAFRLAAMILCLDLQQDKGAQSMTELDKELQNSREDRMKKLEIACRIWGEPHDSDEEAGKFHRVLSAVLQKLRSEEQDPTPISSGTAFTAPETTSLPSIPPSSVGPERDSTTPSSTDQLYNSNNQPLSPPHYAFDLDVVPDAPDLFGSYTLDSLVQAYGFNDPYSAYVSSMPYEF